MPPNRIFLSRTDERALISAGWSAFLKRTGLRPEDIQPPARTKDGDYFRTNPVFWIGKERIAKRNMFEAAESLNNPKTKLTIKRKGPELQEFQKNKIQKVLENRPQTPPKTHRNDTIQLNPDLSQVIKTRNPSKLQKFQKTFDSKEKRPRTAGIPTNSKSPKVLGEPPKVQKK